MARRRRSLTQEEKALWSRVADSVEMRERDLPLSMADIEQEPMPQPAPADPMLHVPQLLRPTGRPIKPGARFDAAPAPGRETLAMDRRAFEKMVRGRLKPQARIDLHGMTAAHAHDALRGFILRTHGNGIRLALVITGKGKRGADDAIIPERYGVLRHQVPQWLRLPPLHSLILQIAPAHRSHGGDGAYYVYLRRARV